MKKLLCKPAVALAFAALFLGLLLPASGVAAAETEAREFAVKAPKASKAPLIATARAGNRLVGVGDHGIVLLSDDNGANWRQARSVATRVMLTGVSFVSEQRGWAVGHGGIVLQSVDGGETWRVQHAADADLALLSVRFQDARHGIAVGSFGRALETTDGGESWKEIVLGSGDDLDRHLNQLFAGAGNTLFVAAEAGTVFRSNDAGKTWQTLKPAYKGSFWNGLALKDGTVLIVGMRGNVFRSENNGESWSQVSTGTTQALSGIAQLADGRVVLVGMSGAVLISQDGGRSFAGTVREDRMNLTSIASGANGQIILFGQSGVVRHVIVP